MFKTTNIHGYREWYSLHGGEAIVTNAVKSLRKPPQTDCPVRGGVGPTGALALSGGLSAKCRVGYLLAGG